MALEELARVDSPVAITLGGRVSPDAMPLYPRRHAHHGPALRARNGCTRPGFMNESPAGRFYRDAKVPEIGEGTSEAVRMLIARKLGPGGSATLFRGNPIGRIN